MAGMGWIDGKELFPYQALLCWKKMPKKDQAGLKPRRWTHQRSIPKKHDLGESHPGAIRTGDNPKAWLAQNPEQSGEKPGNPFSHARLGMLICTDGRTPCRVCSCFHLGLCGCPCWARSGMGHPWSCLDFHGRRRRNGQEGGCALGLSPIVHPGFAMDGTK